MYQGASGPSTGYYAQPAPPPRRRSRAGWVIAIIAVVLLALVVAGDIVGRKVGEDQIAKRLKAQLGTDETPAVTIDGVPFLTQVIMGQYQQITINAKDVPFDMPLSRLSVALKDVKGDMNFTSATAKTVTGTATVAYGELSKRAGFPVEFSSPDKVKVDVSVTVFGQTVRASVTGTPKLDAANQSISIGDVSVSVAGSSLPSDIAQSAIDALVKPIKIPLPESLKANSVKATDAGIEVGIAGDNVDLTKLHKP